MEFNKGIIDENANLSLHLPTNTKQGIQDRLKDLQGGSGATRTN
jgi:hypothetical protein